MTITKTENGKEITLALEGRLDTNSAPELEKVLAEFGVYPQSLVLDFESLSYISSAGLRFCFQLRNVRMPLREHW